MTRISTTIMAHPDRRDLVARLQDRIDGPPVVWDRDAGVWDTGRRALLDYDPAADWHLVIQDDAVVPRDLIAGAVRALGRLPADGWVSLYSGNTGWFWRAVRRRRIHIPDDASWLTVPRVWGVAVAAPTCDIDAMVGWCDDLTDVDSYDQRISAWVAEHDRTVWCPWLNLVDHRIDTATLIDGHDDTPGYPRHSVAFIGADASALAQPLDGPTVDLSAVARDVDERRRRRARQLRRRVGAAR